MNSLTSISLSHIVLVQFDFLILGITLVYLTSIPRMISEVKFLPGTSETSNCRTSTASSKTFYKLPALH